MSQLVKVNESSHWYTKTGEPCHEVPAKKGGMKSVTVREAREMGLLPSVTNILGVIAKPSLNAWLQSQAIYASLTLPKLPDEDLDAYAKRVITDMNAHSEGAKDMGTQIHAVCEEWAKSSTPTGDERLMPYQLGFAKWLDDECTSVLWSEKRVVGEDYAGTADLAVVHKKHGPALVDLKSQDVKKAPVFYDEWSYQNSAYAAAAPNGEFMRTANLILDKRAPGKTYFQMWTPEEQAEGLRAFNAAKTLWQIQKGYDPRNVKAVAA